MNNKRKKNENLRLSKEIQSYIFSFLGFLLITSTILELFQCQTERNLLYFIFILCSGFCPTSWQPQKPIPYADNLLLYVVLLFLLNNWWSDIMKCSFEHSTSHPRFILLEVSNKTIKPIHKDDHMRGIAKILSSCFGIKSPQNLCYRDATINYVGKLFLWSHVILR